MRNIVTAYRTKVRKVIHLPFIKPAFTIPPVLSISSMEYVIEFTKKSRYSFKHHSDQLDWRKAPGLKNGYFKQHKRSCMVGWRYSDITNGYELTPYVHSDIRPDERFIKVGTKNGYALNESLKYKEGDKIRVKITGVDDGFNMWIDSEYYRFDFVEKKDAKFYRTISWFGGSKASRKIVTYLVQWFRRV